MTFKLVSGEDRTFKAKVKFQMPNDKGTHDTVGFTAIYRMMPTDEAAKSTDLTALEFARRVLIGFEDVQDENGNAVDFSEENKEALLQVAVVAINVARTYHDAVNKGLPQAKN